MAKITKVRKAGDAKRALLDMGLKLVLLGSALLVASIFLAGKPMLAPVAQGIRIAAPWAIFIGALLLVLYFVVRRTAKPTTAKHPDPIVFGQSTTTFQEPPPVAREKR